MQKKPQTIQRNNKKNNKRLFNNILASAWVFQELHISLLLHHILVDPFFIFFMVWMNARNNFQLVAAMLVVEFDWNMLKKKNKNMTEPNMQVVQYFIIFFLKGFTHAFYGQGKKGHPMYFFLQKFKYFYLLILDSYQMQKYFNANWINGYYI